MALEVLHSAFGSRPRCRALSAGDPAPCRLHRTYILPLYDSGSAGGRLHYTMPYVLPVCSAIATGGPAFSTCEPRCSSPPEWDALPDWPAILADFGIAHALDNDVGDSVEITPSGGLTETGATVGTPAYMSPEQAADDEALTSRSEANPDVPAELEAVLLRALSCRPTDRFESMESFARGERDGEQPARRGPCHPSCGAGPCRTGDRLARDADSGPFVLTQTARIYTLAGQPERAELQQNPPPGRRSDRIRSSTPSSRLPLDGL